MTSSLQLASLASDQTAAAAMPVELTNRGGGNDARVLILAPSGKDAELTKMFLNDAGVQSEVCQDLPAIIREMGVGCGALLLAEETLDAQALSELSSALAHQPSWSDIPVSIVTSRGETDVRRREEIDAFGRETSIVLIERPFRPATLIRVLVVALRTRERQYQMRDLWMDLKSSEARIRRLLEQTAVGLAELDLEGRFTMVNDQFCHIAGRSRETLLRLRMRDITHSEDGPAAAVRRELLFSGIISRSVIEKRYSRPDGAVVWVQDHLSSIRDLDGKLCGIAVASADITDRKTAEEAAGRARDEAVAASRAKDDFLAALSHELRTPLNPVLLLASEGADNPEYPAAARGDFETITRNVALEARLFEDLLDLTRITQGKLSLERQLHDLHESLREALTTVKRDIEQKKIELRCEWNLASMTVLADPARLQQVFWNVLKNAVKFTPPGGAIDVKTFVRGESAMVEIADTGIGLAPTEIDRIFEIFAQGDHAAGHGAHRFGGLGLGLAISKKIVGFHGGKISASSEGSGKGATFTVELPLASIPVASEPVSVCNSIGGATPEKSGGGRRVLLVEDHEPTRLTLGRLLNRRGFSVLTAASVKEAQTAARENPIDLLLSDIGLPDGTGYELMQALRTKPGVVGIALTGYGQENDVVLSHEAGFAAHLTKPVDIRSLDKVLSELTAVRESSGA